MLSLEGIKGEVSKLLDLMVKLKDAQPCPNNEYGRFSAKRGKKDIHGTRYLGICPDCGDVRCERCPQYACQCQNDE